MGELCYQFGRVQSSLVFCHCLVLSIVHLIPFLLELSFLLIFSIMFHLN